MKATNKLSVRLENSLSQFVLPKLSYSFETRLRSLGWAILFGVVLLDTGLVDNPKQAVIGEKILTRVSEDG